MLKGHTKIELTDVETGERQVYEEDNLFTNLLDELINDNSLGRSILSAAPDSFLPLPTVALGGLLLFDETITESVDTIYPPFAPFAYAGSDTDAGSNTSKGTYNVTESGKLSNGYKHVWDFTTSQGNGTVACVGLTHNTAGNSFPGSVHTVEYGGFSDDWFHTCQLMNKTARFFVGWSRTNTRLEVRILNTPIDTWPSVNAKRMVSGVDYTVAKSILISDSDDQNTINGGGILFRVANGHCYGYAHIGNTTGDAEIYTIDIDVNTLDYTEGSITISDLALPSFGPYARKPAIIRDHYLYAVNPNDNTIILKIDLDNTADITEITLPSYTTSIGFDAVSGWLIVGQSMLIFEDDSVCSTAAVFGGYPSWNTIIKEGIRQVGRITDAHSYNDNYYLYSYLLPGYLATINNLASPIIKTSSQTMKVTYTITDTSEVTLLGISVTSAPATTRYEAGSTLDLSGMVVTAVYSDGTTEDVTASCTFSPADGSTLSSTSINSVTITYTDGDVTRTQTQPITVYAASALSITTAPTTTTYSAGDTLDLTGLVMTAAYTDGTTAIVTSDCSYSPANGDTLTSGTSAVTASYTCGGVTKTASIAISVVERTLSSIAVTTPPTKTSYAVGDTLDLTGIVVTATFSDSSTEVVTNGCTFSPADGSTLSTEGTQTITISYTSGGTTQTTTQTVTVTAISTYLPNSDPSTIDCFATLDNFTDGSSAWGEGSAPITTTGNLTLHSDGGVYLDCLAGQRLISLPLPNRGSDFTVYVVAKAINYASGDVMVLGSVYSWSSLNEIMLYHREGNVWRSSVYGSDEDLIDTNGSFVVVAIRSSSMKASWFASNGASRKDVSYNNHGTTFSFGGYGTTYHSNLAAKFIAYSNVAESDADITANVANLATVFGIS